MSLIENFFCTAELYFHFQLLIVYIRFYKVFPKRLYSYMCKYSSKKKRLNYLHCFCFCCKSLCMRHDMNIACGSCLPRHAAMASGFQEAWLDLHFSRFTNTGDGPLQSWATVLLRLGLLGGRIAGQCPLATALGFSHRTYCSCTERGSKTRPRQSVRRCWAGHNCRDL